MTGNKIARRERAAQSDGLHPVTLDEWQAWCDTMNEAHSEALYQPNAKKAEHVLQRKPGSDAVFFMVKSDNCAWPCGYHLRKIHYRSLGSEAYILQLGDGARKWFKGCGMDDATIDKLAKRIRMVATAKDKEARERLGPMSPDEEERAKAWLLHHMKIDVRAMGDDGRKLVA